MDIVKLLKDVWHKMWYTDLFTGKEVESIAPELESYIKKVSGSGLTAADKESAALQYEYQKQSMDYSNAINRQNLIDQASLEVEGYKKAGLNPALMYSSGIGSGVGSPNAGGVSVPVSSAPSQLLNLLGSVLMSSVSNKTNLRIAEMQNKTALELGNKELKLKESEISSQNKSRELQQENQSLLNSILSETKPWQVAKIKSDAEISKETIGQVHQLVENLKAENARILAQTKTEGAHQSALYAQAYLSKASAWQIYQLTPSMLQLNQQQFDLGQQSQAMNAIELRIKEQLEPHQVLAMMKEYGETIWKYSSNSLSAKFARGAARGLTQVITAGAAAGALGLSFGKSFGTGRVAASTTPSYYGTSNYNFSY